MCRRFHPPANGMVVGAPDFANGRPPTKADGFIRPPLSHLAVRRLEERQLLAPLPASLLISQKILQSRIVEHCSGPLNPRTRSPTC